MDHYLKLDDPSVEKLYFQKEEKSLEFSKDNGSREIYKIHFATIKKELQTIQYGLIKKKTEIATETQNDAKTLSNKVVSPLLDTTIADSVSDNFSTKLKKAKEKNKLDTTIESKFKKYQIAKAVSSSIAKKNQLLNSSYHLPEPENLKDFISTIYNLDQKCTSIILLSILLGTNIKNIIYGLKNKDGMKYEKTKHRIIFNINKDLFAKSMGTEFELFYKITYKSYIYLSPLFEEILLKAQQYIDDHEKYDIIMQNINNLLQLGKKKHIKTIIITLNSLSSITYQYFKRFNQNSNISLLYIKEVTRNEQAKLCYCTSNDRLYNLEKWIIELSNILDLHNLFKKNNKINIALEYHNKVGSNYYLKPGIFKNFILNIFRLYNTLTTDIEKLNLRMIYLRYSLALLLATRDFGNSCNLLDFSQRLRVLLLQEKAKSIYTSKRIIPLCTRAIEEIKKFYELKTKYNLISNYPVFLDKNTNNEIGITKKSSIEIIKKMQYTNNGDLIQQIIYFIQYTKLNFGRHIITSYMAHSDNIRSDYVDAFLNHFSMGKEDQGIFSNFNNSDYINTITDAMEEIIQIYYPNKYKDSFDE